MATVLAPSRADRAFERLYRRYVADVYRYVLAVLQNEADAEDATQTAFLQAYRAYERGERAERPLNWLIAIAHNVCRQRFRESARRPRLVELEDNVAARSGDDEAPNAEEIRRALGFLAFNQRAALVMRELQGRSYSEIGRILGLSTSAVETLLFRARRALREQLEGALTCGEAELALSKRADGELQRSERGPLRAHLRECADCAALERGSRFRSRAIKGLGAVPLPSSLGSFFGGGAVGTGAGAGVGVGAKAAAVVVAAVVGGGVAGDAMKQSPKPTIDEAAARATSAPALVQDRSDRPRAAVETGTGVRVVRAIASRRPPPAERPQQPDATAPTAAAPNAPTEASTTAPPQETTPAAPESTPEPARSVPAPQVPTLPSLPVPAPRSPKPPAAPALPESRLPELPSLPQLPPPPPLDLPPPPSLTQPTTPSLPALPKVPDLEVPRVELPEARIELSLAPGGQR
jgi:RNA polymerase sigma factor (sigma-70 family)